MNGIIPTSKVSKSKNNHSPKILKLSSFKVFSKVYNGTMLVYWKENKNEGGKCALGKISQITILFTPTVLKKIELLFVCC